MLGILICIMYKFKNCATFGVAAVLLSCGLFWIGDFGMAIVSRSTLGTPSKQVAALYYTYWVVERLPLLTF